MLISLGETWKKLFGELLSSVRPLIHASNVDVAFKMAFYILSLIRAQVLAPSVSKLISESAILGCAVLKKSSIFILIADISIWGYLLLLGYSNTFRMRMFMSIFLESCFILALFCFKLSPLLRPADRLAQKFTLTFEELSYFHIHIVQVCGQYFIAIAMQPLRNSLSANSL